MVTEFYDALRKAGVDEGLARDAARAVLPAEASTDLATKADVGILKADLKADFAVLRGEFAQHRADTRADLAEMKSDLLKWNVGAMAALTAIFAAISRLG